MGVEGKPGGVDAPAWLGRGRTFDTGRRTHFIDARAGETDAEHRTWLRCASDTPGAPPLIVPFHGDRRVIEDVTSFPRSAFLAGSPLPLYGGHLKAKLLLGKKKTAADAAAAQGGGVPVTTLRRPSVDSHASGGGAEGDAEGDGNGEGDAPSKGGRDSIGSAIPAPSLAGHVQPSPAPPPAVPPPSDAGDDQSVGSTFSVKIPGPQAVADGG